ncbi:MAG: hypothetical protein LBG92_00565 [Prevotellaceae bacterium]|nr:hypothetical protein [Prevotellaceae bacterium]
MSRLSKTCKKDKIFVTAGECSVACGIAKAPNLPDWAKRLSRLCSAHSGSGCLYVSLSAGNATLACGYENFVPQGQIPKNRVCRQSGTKTVQNSH